MEFTERSVLLLIRSKPYGAIFNFEGWRASVGMFGMDHEPMMLFMGDGVFSILKGMNDLPIRMFKMTFQSFDGRICVSKKSLEAHNIGPDELIEGVEVLDEAGIGKAFMENEIVLTF
jgi:sulfur relay (sulfurtransferase) DsrF/TusC family protein